MRLRRHTCGEAFLAQGATCLSHPGLEGLLSTAGRPMWETHPVVPTFPLACLGRGLPGPLWLVSARRLSGACSAAAPKQ